MARERVQAAGTRGKGKEGEREVWRTKKRLPGKYVITIRDDEEGQVTGGEWR